LEAIKVGAAGYVLKDATQEELVSAVRRVLCGESPLNQELAARLLRRLSHQSREQAEVASIPRRADLLQPLTPRELEVLEMLAVGWTNRQIAQDFHITTGTVKNHVEHIIAKLGVSDRTYAVVRALKLGLISFPER
jgi:DNA-binding NarL/FixJ family response regulator